MPRLKLRPPKSRPVLVDILSAQPSPQRDLGHMKIMRYLRHLTYSTEGAFPKIVEFRPPLFGETFTCVT